MFSPSIIIVITASFISCALAVPNLELHKAAFEDFKLNHNKIYDSPDEELMRFEIFAENLQLIHKHNAEASSKAGFKLGVNHLTDLTKDERRILNGLRMPPKNELQQLALSEDDQKYIESLLNSDEEVPNELDWTKVENVVSEVKDQGTSCGSCWAFATTGVLEGQEAKNKSLVADGSSITELSEQDLVDCSKNNNGCQGGIMLNALIDIHNMGGIEKESDYPYEGKDKKCRFKKSKVFMSDKGGIILEGRTEDELKKIVANYGPVSVGIFANLSSFMFYKEGVFNDENCSNLPEDLDHGVLVVGYGVDEEHGDYWIVKNSWGPKWGEKGYIRIARNKDNLCGIVNIPTIAKLSQ